MRSHLLAGALSALVATTAALDAVAVELVSSPTPVAASDDDRADRLTALELALAKIVAERPNLWRFEALEAEAAALLLESRTPAERDEVRQIADRIDRFAAIGLRYREARGVLPIAGGDRRRESATIARSTPAPSTSKAPQYDAVGVLRPVVSQRENAPRFALVNDEGKVTTLLTPSPDLNLQPLLGKRIGVRGTRGFIPEYKRNYITASRAAPLDTVRR